MNTKIKNAQIKDPDLWNLSAKEYAAKHNKLPIGNAVAAIAQPIANAIDAVAGTDIKNCSGCAKRHIALNKLGDTIANLPVVKDLLK